MSLPAPSQGSLPASAGSLFAGQVSHLLDSKRSFMELSHLPILLDQQGLVALCGPREWKREVLASGRAWAGYAV
jgi:hypothetical protein